MDRKPGIFDVTVLLCLILISMLYFHNKCSFYCFYCKNWWAVLLLIMFESVFQHLIFLHLVKGESWLLAIFLFISWRQEDRDLQQKNRAFSMSRASAKSRTCLDKIYVGQYVLKPTQIISVNMDLIPQIILQVEVKYLFSICSHSELLIFSQLASSFIFQSGFISFLPYLYPLNCH